ncbi:MAG: hypothetical protein WD004_06410 [Actinomycetota bacterium]
MGSVPIDDVVRQIRDTITRGDEAQYFFQQLKSPDWLAPLKRAGFFDALPPLEELPEGYVRFPTWPAAGYLERMAQLAPGEVAEIILNLGLTKNARAIAGVVEVALALPPDRAGRVAPMASVWLEQSAQLYVPDALGKLMAYLAKAGEIRGARQVAEALLFLERSPDIQIGDGLTMPAHARVRFAKHDLAEILETSFADLARADPIPTVQLLATKLALAIRLPREKELRSAYEDYSYIWKSDLRAPDNDHEVEGYLVSAVLAISRMVVESDPGALSSIVDLLWVEELLIHDRVATLLVAELAPEGDPLLTQTLSRPRLAENSHLWEEVEQLVARLSEVPKDARDTFVARLLWVEPESIDEDADDELRQRVSLRADRSLTIKLGSLPASFLTPEQHRDLENAQGRLSAYRSTLPGELEGDKALHDAAESLGGLTPAEVIALIEEVDAASPVTQDALEHLGDAFTARVASDAPAFSGLAQQLEGLSPLAVQSFMRGLRQSEADEPLSWRPLLSLMAWVVDQPRADSEARRSHPDIDPGWAWTRDTAIDLVDDALRKPASRPRDMDDVREPFWGVIRLLADDPDPDSDRDKEVMERSREHRAVGGPAAELSINSIRGRALHAAFNYLRWIIESDEPSAKGATLSFLAPGLLSLVEEKLETDPSPAVRSVIGTNMVLLDWVDPVWVQDSREKVFSRSGTGLDVLGQAAWDSFITFTRNPGRLFSTLQTEFEIAVQALDAAADSRRDRESPAANLGQHIVVRYWFGDLSLDSPFIEGYFERAAGGDRANALTFIGRNLKLAEPEVVQRVIELWEWRRSAIAFDTAAPDGYRQELAAFGWWAKAPNLDAGWVVDQLLFVTSLGVSPDLEHLVTQRLVEAVHDFPLSVAQVTEHIIINDRDAWLFQGPIDDFTVILSALADTRPSEAWSIGYGVANRLVAMGNKSLMRFAATPNE